MQLDFPARELTIKLVYYGPALSGKTTNLQAIHRLLPSDTRGRLMTLATKDDRTLFFDMLPLAVQTSHGLNVRVKLFTVPGQVIHNATRRHVLQGVDGVAFIADSQRSEHKTNQDAFTDLRENLRENGFDPACVPIVIQFNKRDLADVRSDEEIDALAAKGREKVYKAVAIRGTGVRETFLGLLDVTCRHLDKEHHLSEKLGVDLDALLAEMQARLATSAVAAVPRRSSP